MVSFAVLFQNYWFHWFLISLTTDFTDSFGRFTNQLLLLRLANRINNFQNSFVSRISSKHNTLYDIDSKFIWVFCDSSYYLHNCSTYNSPLYLRSNDDQSWEVTMLWFFNHYCCSNARSSHLQLYWKRDSGTGVFLWIWRNF